MKKRGFTLIELLAVIVILAVIALIVTPVITGIIKETKDSADLRSAEEYVKAGENYFASSTLNNKLLNTNVINSLELSSSPATASDYWTITQYADSTNSWRTLSTGRLYKDVYTNTQAIRPVIVIKSDVSVTSGTGLSTSPYQI